jgi:hypothetical protein
MLHFLRVKVFSRQVGGRFCSAQSGKIEFHFGRGKVTLRCMNMRGLVFGVLLSVIQAILPPGTAQGVTNLLSNGDLENVQGTFVADGYQVMSLPMGSKVIPGWTVIGSELVWGSNSNPLGIKTPSGAMFLDLTGYHDSLPYSGIEQTIPTVSGKHYRVSGMVGADQDNGAYSAPVAVKVIAASLTNEFTLIPPARAAGNIWQAFSVPYVATGSSTPITVQGVSTAGGRYIGLDNLSFKAPGGTELLQNGSLENVSGTFVPDGNGAQSLLPASTSIPGWTVGAAEASWISNTNHFGGATPAGSYFVDLTGFHDSAPYAALSQTVPTVAGVQYELLFSLGTLQDAAPYRGPVAATVTIGTQQNTYTLNPPGAANQWQTFTFSFQATSTSTTVQVIGSKSTGGQYIGLDNLVVTADQIFNVRSSNGVLSFDSDPGAFTTETTTDLELQSWQPITLNETKNPDGTKTLTFPLNDFEAQRFFRLRAL